MQALYTKSCWSTSVSLPILEVVYLNCYKIGFQFTSTAQDTSLDMVEFFAGCGSLTRCMKLSGLTAASLDIKYQGSKQPRIYSSNAMDMTSCSGFWQIGSSTCGSYWLEVPSYNMLQY